jgi:uncharacterized protein YceK
MRMCVSEYHVCRRRAVFGRSSAVAKSVLALVAGGLMTAHVSGCAAIGTRISWLGTTSGKSKVGNELIPIPEEPYPFYQGTMIDVACIEEALALVRGETRDTESVRPGTLVFAPVCLMDLPLSGVVDTVLLPVDWWRHRRYWYARNVHDERVKELRQQHSPGEDR